MAKSPDKAGRFQAGLSILRQPLVVFLIGAGFIFLFDAVRPASPDEAAARIAVTPQQLEQLNAGFERSWGRAPTDTEQAAMVEEWLEDEVFYRQAVALDLGADDPVIRRYLANKMRFLSEDSVVVPQAGEAELRAYYETHRSDFMPDPEYDLVVIRLSPMSDEAGERLMRALAAGDPIASALPGAEAETYRRAGRVEISRRYGISFFEDLSALQPATWHGPIASSVGLHLVRLEAVHQGEVPPFETVRAKVAERWSRDKREALERAALEKLGRTYDLDPDDFGN